MFVRSTSCSLAVAWLCCHSDLVCVAEIVCSQGSAIYVTAKAPLSEDLLAPRVVVLACLRLTLQKIAVLVF